MPTAPTITATHHVIRLGAIRSIVASVSLEFPVKVVFRGAAPWLDDSRRGEARQAGRVGDYATYNTANPAWFCCPIRPLWVRASVMRMSSCHGQGPGGSVRRPGRGSVRGG